VDETLRKGAAPAAAARYAALGHACGDNFGVCTTEPAIG
jgi:hypothetical protein